MSGAALVYETEDTDFADACIGALEAGGIEGYRTGGAVAGGSTHLVCVYVRRAADLPRANALLVKLGAAVDRPVRWPAPRVMALLALAAAALVIIVAVNFR